VFAAMINSVMEWRKRARREWMKISTGIEEKCCNIRYT
jgi:hypothetical protein